MAIENDMEFSIFPSDQIIIQTPVDSEMSPDSENPIQTKVVYEELEKKVDKEEGKQLSTENYTTTEKEKLNDLPNLQELNDNFDKKVDKVVGKSLSTNDYTDEEKTKLQNLPTKGDLDDSLSAIDNSAEKITNKTSVLNQFSTDTQYPTAKAVYDITDALENSTDLLESKTNNLEANKVTKETGKGLSSNDYTDSAKNKVDAIPKNPKYTDTIYDDTELRNTKADKATTLAGYSIQDAYTKTEVQGLIDDLKEVIPQGKDYSVTVDTTITTDGAAKSYTFKQLGKDIVTVDIPKDMVVSNCEVKNLKTKPDDFPEGQTFAAGMYIILTIANSTASKLYIPAVGLADIYTGGGTTTIETVVGDNNAILSHVKTGSINKTLLTTTLQNKIDEIDNKVNKTDYAVEGSKAGIVKPDAAFFEMTKLPGSEDFDFLTVHSSSDPEIESRAKSGIITPAVLNKAVKAALTDDNKIFDMTDDEQEKARQTIGAIYTTSDNKFSDFSFPTLYAGRNEGLAKFTIQGDNAKITPDPATTGFIQAYWYMSAEMKDKKPDLPHVKFKFVDTNLNALCDTIELYGLPANHTSSGHTYTNSEKRDTLTEEYLTQNLSDEWYPKAEYINEDLIQISGTSVLFELRIPEKAFGEQIPYKNSPSTYYPVICPMSRMISEEHLLAMTSYDNLYNQLMSFAWHAANPDGATDIEKSGYYSLHLGSKTDGSTKQDLIKKLFYSKWYIKYSLAKPIVKYNTPKLYMHDLELINIDREVNSYAPIVKSFKTPDNIAASVKGIEQLTKNILDLNKRVENVEVNDVSFGYPDGSTDNYDYIMSLLDNNNNTGVNKIIDIPAGTYYVSKPIFIKNAHTTIRGNGEVIIKCPSNQPAIVIEASYTTIEGITFYLSKIEDSATAENNDGHHSAIYVDTGKGIYNTKIINCDFQGAYRLSTKDKEYSYGIYFAHGSNSLYNPNEYGYTYFNIIDNCRFYSVYCGLYIADGTQPSKIWFSFDAGENIYDIADVKGDPKYNALGCAYGCICDGTANFIRFDGQFIGENHTTPTNPVFETVDGVKKAISATINNVSICAVKCNSGQNYIEGFAYDVQRCDKGYIWFTKKAKNNMFSLLYFGTQIGTNYNLTFADTYTVYDSDNTSYSLTMIRDHAYLTDETGLNNCVNAPIGYQHDIFFGSTNPLAVDSTGQITQSAQPKHFGIQDNALAYLPEWGQVECYTYTTQDNQNVKVIETLYKNDGVTTTTIDEIFTAYSSTGWSEIIMENTPTTESPIYLDLNFTKNSSLERLMIKFGDHIAKDFDVLPFVNFEIASDSSIAIRNNNQGQVDISLYHNINGYSNWKNVTGIRFVFKEALSIGNYNTNKKIGICNIFGLSSNHGGKSYMPRNGGELYGDLNSFYSAWFKDGVKIGGNQASEGSSVEVKSNKITSLSSTSTDEEYPSAKAAWDQISRIEIYAGQNIQGLNSIIASNKKEADAAIALKLDKGAAVGEKVKNGGEKFNSAFLASGVNSHAENAYTEATAENTHAEGIWTYAYSVNQHVQGKCNIKDKEGKYAHIVGNGQDPDHLSNAHTLDWDGNAWFEGKVSIGTENKTLETETSIQALALVDNAITYALSSTSHNVESRISTVLETATITITLSSDSYPNNYISSLVFTTASNSNITMAYTGSGALQWIGTDCNVQDGYSVFVPKPSKTYDIVFYFNGTRFIGLVNGYENVSVNTGA